MLTPNSKVTALEILQECGIKDAESKFGEVRVRIGGIAGINRPDYLVNIPQSATEVEVIVGNEIYDLKLSEGNSENNSEIRTISDAAHAVLEDEGKQASYEAEELQKAKAVALKLKERGGKYEPTKEEAPYLERATEIYEADVAAAKQAANTEETQERKEITSK